jgi:RHS repeat-associated protein
VAEYSTQIAQTPQVSYLTTDHLGSPRVITNENGVVKDRKDFSAFGEETVSAQRSSNAEYTPPDQLRKNYTGYEKDSESGLEFAQARYYNPTHGRFTRVDPLIASASIKNPQTFNRYSYVLNSPYKFTDPLGLLPATKYIYGGAPAAYGCGAEFSSCSDSWGSGFQAPLPENHTNEAAEPPAATHEAGHATQQQAKEPEPPPTLEPGVITIGRVEVFEDDPREITSKGAPFPRPGAKATSSVDPLDEAKSATVNAPNDIGEQTFYIRVTASMSGDAEFVNKQDDLENSPMTGVRTDSGAGAMWKHTKFLASENYAEVDIAKDTSSVTFAVKLNNKNGSNRPFIVSFVGKSTQGTTERLLVRRPNDPVRRIEIKINRNETPIF